MTTPFQSTKPYFDSFVHYPDPSTDPEVIARLKGCQDGREQLVYQCSKIVRDILSSGFRKYWNDEILDELASTGYEAVIDAVDSFDPYRGMLLKSWAWRLAYRAILVRMLKEEKYRKHHVSADFDEPPFDNEDTARLLDGKMFPDYDLEATEERELAQERAMRWKAEYELIKQQLNRDEQVVLEGMLAGENQSAIAKQLQVSQPTVSRLISEIVNKIVGSPT